MLGLRHDVVIVTRAPDALDPEGEDWGHPDSTEVLGITCRGWVQPRSAREKLATTSAGASVGDFLIFLEAGAIGLVDVDALVRKFGDPDADLNGDYRIVGGVSNAAGIGHHLEVGAELIQP